MSSSQEVTKLRKDGRLDEAYAMALVVIAESPNDEWGIRALGWCLYDLIKRELEENNQEQAKDYFRQLDELRVSEADKILYDSIERARQLVNPDNKRAWEYYRVGKTLFDGDNVDVQQAKQLLFKYIRLNNDRPELVHSLFLTLANKLSDKKDFQFFSFLKLWNLKNLRPEDYEPFKADDGKLYPSLAEKTLQHGAKCALAERASAQDISNYLPFLDDGIARFPSNIWLLYNKAKLLQFVGRNKEAFTGLIPVVKEKIGEYWTWNLLADLLISTDEEVALSCFCKALLCGGEEKFLATMRIKFAELLIKKGLFNEAKFEISSVIRTKTSEGARIPEVIMRYQKEEWYKNAAEKVSNNDFYGAHKELAEKFIFSTLPWLDGCIGESFTIPDKPGKLRRKLFIKIQEQVVEVVVSDRKFNTSKNFYPGDAIRVKGEYDKDRRLQLYLLERRDSSEKWDLFSRVFGNYVHPIRGEHNEITAWVVVAFVDNQQIDGIINVSNIEKEIKAAEGLPIYIKCHKTLSHLRIFTIENRPEGTLWDTFPEYIGLVDHINNEKGIAHFLVSQQIEGIVKLNELDGSVDLFGRLLLKLHKVKKSDGSMYYKTLTSSVTRQDAPEGLMSTFEGTVRRAEHVGFVDDVFIENSLIEKHEIKDRDIVKGTAILSFNNKRGEWSRRAIDILSKQ